MSKKEKPKQEENGRESRETSWSDTEAVKKFGSNSLLKRNPIYPSEQDGNMWELVDFDGNRSDYTAGLKANRRMGHSSFRYTKIKCGGLFIFYEFYD